MVAEGLITLSFAALGSLILWKLIGPRIVSKAIQDKMGPILMDWLLRPQFKTGRKKVIKDEDGEENEIEEILSPLQLIMKEAGDLVYQKLMGKLGGDARKRDAIQGDIIEGLANPASPFAGLLNSVNPRLLDRALKDGDYVPIILDQLGPLISKWAEKKLNTSQGAPGSGAGW